MKPILIIVSILIVLFIAYAIGISAKKGEDSAVNDSPTLSSESVPSSEPTPYDGPVNPLTGLPASADVVNLRPYAIMLDNISAGQPLVGITRADIIYEILVEGGITRMMAIYQDVFDVEEIGGIRSARPYFVEIASGYDAIFIHAGGSNDAYATLNATGIAHLDGVNGSKQDIFFRDKNRVATLGSVHSLVTSGTLISQYLPGYGVKLMHPSSYTSNMTFADNAAPTDDHAASSVTVHFSASKTTTFTYSAENARYDVSQFGFACVDGIDNTPLQVKNLLVLRTGINTISGDSKGRIEVDVTGSGTGIFFCDGKYEAITWSKAYNSSQFKYKRSDGTPLVFGRGKTFVSIIDVYAKIDIA